MAEDIALREGDLKAQKGRVPHAGGEQLKLGGLSVVGGKN